MSAKAGGEQLARPGYLKFYRIIHNVPTNPFLVKQYGPDRTTGASWGHGQGVAHLGQMGVEPVLRRRGIGKELIRYVERIAREDGAVEIALDTAEPARHLIKWYERLGYRFVKYVDWDMTNYRSVIMSKML